MAEAEGAPRRNRRATDARDLVSSLASKEVVVCCGSGGVGKTTVSAALGMAMVAAEEKRVMVLTVDPARRLATSLGLAEMGADPVAVPPSRLRRAGIRPRGELVAAMLDMKSTWDRLVERYAPDRNAAERILGNPFYKGMSDAFIGSHEYAAMESLYELHAADEYDCIIVDTPPSRNALDFLEAPDRFTDFVGARLLAWLAGPSRLGLRAVNIAALPFLRMADRLLGSEMLASLAEFVRDLQTMYGSVQGHARDVYALLRSARTAFVVVTTLEPAPFAEAEFFCTKLHDYSMPLRAVVVNRVLDESLRSGPGVAAASALMDGSGAARWLAQELGVPVTGDMLAGIADAYLTLHRIAERDSRQLQRLVEFGRVPVLPVPLAERDVVDLEGLAAMADRLRGRI